MRRLPGIREKKQEILPAGYLFDNRALKRLIAPLIIEQILAVTVGMVDTMMVSSVGEAATSGVSLVDMINTLLINVFAAVATGGAVVASQYLGQKNRKRACESAVQLLIVTGIISLLVMGGVHPVSTWAAPSFIWKSGTGRHEKCTGLSCDLCGIVSVSCNL